MSTRDRPTLSERMALARHRTIEARALKGLPADTQPMPNLEPTSESNRRVAVLLKVKSGSQL